MGDFAVTFSTMERISLILRLSSRLKSLKKIGRPTSPIKQHNSAIDQFQENPTVPVNPEAMAVILTII